MAWLAGPIPNCRDGACRRLNDNTSRMSGERNLMKIMATSDLHGNLEGLDPTGADIVVLAGDIAPLRGRGAWHINDQKKWINKRFREWTASFPDIQFVVIPGNHDFWLTDYLAGKIECELPPNFHLLLDKEEIFYGLHFYGTPWVPWINGKWCFEASDKTLEYEFAGIPKGIDVLITHSPPEIKHKFVDISMTHDKRYWRHFGSAALTKEIQAKAPHIVFCGHIHTGDHKCNVINTTSAPHNSLCYNVSRVDEKYQVTYPLTVLKVRDKTVVECNGNFR